VGADDPIKWAERKRDAIKRDTAPDVAAMIAHARDVLMPGVPVAAFVGFTANGDPYNTTGWRVGDDNERAEAVRKGRFPFKNKNPNDHDVYGHIGSNDLHELERFGVEGSRCPTPCATDPECAWVVGVRSDDVRKVLGCAGVEGAVWYGAVEDAIAIGVWNLKRHMNAARRELDPRLSWDRDDKPVTLWMFFCAMSRWSAGGRGVRHINRYADRLATLAENARVGEFMRAAGEVNDPGNRHAQDEYTALRDAQKIEAGRAACARTGEDVAWFADGLDADRAAVYAALVRSASA
jgi:hypothetical protein